MSEDPRLLIRLIQAEDDNKRLRHMNTHLSGLVRHLEGVVLAMRTEIEECDGNHPRAQAEADAPTVQMPLWGDDQGR